MIYLLLLFLLPLLLVPLVVAVVRRRSELYLGEEELEKRLRKHKITLVHNRLEFEGVVMVVSEYWQVFEKENRRVPYTRLEYYYAAPLLRYFHLAKRPQEEVINRTHAASLEMVETGEPSFDALFVIRTKTGAETLEIVTDALRDALVKQVQESNGEVEFFDSFMRYAILGKPSYVGTETLVDHIKRAKRFAVLLEEGRKRKPLPDEQQRMREALERGTGGGLELRRCPDGGVDLIARTAAIAPLYFTMTAGTNGFYIRVPLVERERPLFAFSETSFPQEYPTARYLVQAVTLEGRSPLTSRFRILYVLPKGKKRSRDGSKGQASFHSSNQRRVFNIFMKKIVGAGVLDVMDEALATLEDVCLAWSQDRFPTLEMNSKHLRAFIPGPIPESLEVGQLLEPLAHIRGEFERAESGAGSSANAANTAR